MTSASGNQLERTRDHAAAALRAHDLADLAAALEEAPDPMTLAMTAGQAVPTVPEQLVPILLDTADDAFAAPMPVRPCMLSYVGARTARFSAELTGASVDEADLAERRWQGAWLAEALELDR